MKTRAGFRRDVREVRRSCGDGWENVCVCVYEQVNRILGEIWKSLPTSGKVKIFTSVNRVGFWGFF